MERVPQVNCSPQSQGFVLLRQWSRAEFKLSAELFLIMHHIHNSDIQAEKQHIERFTPFETASSTEGVVNFFWVKGNLLTKFHLWVWQVLSSRGSACGGGDSGQAGPQPEVPPVQEEVVEKGQCDWVTERRGRSQTNVGSKCRTSTVDEENFLLFFSAATIAG